MKRGRPPKFGRPAKLVALTLPDDVLAWLQSINPDPRWAIVTLFERQGSNRSVTQERTTPNIELVSVAPRRALIVVRQAMFHALPGVDIVPLGGGRAFLALDPGMGMADLELTVIDQLEQKGLSAGEQDSLRELRQQLKAWREDKDLAFTSQSIIIVEQRQGRRTLSSRGPRVHK